MTEILTVTATVDAPAAAVFGVLDDPSTHKDIDGTGWVRDPLDSQPLSAVGQVFRVAQVADGPRRSIPTSTSRWPTRSSRYDLEPLGAEQTRVTLTYDWSKVPAAIRENIPFPAFPVSHLDNSLANLAKLAKVRSTT